MSRKPAELIRSLRYAIGDLLYALARLLRPLTTRVTRAWGRLQKTTQRRFAVAGSAIAVIAIVELLIVPALPCSFPGGDECAKPTQSEALELVPGNAIAYVHADIDPTREQYAKAVGIASRTPLLTRQIGSIVLSQFLGSAGRPSDFVNQIRPWLGSEIAIATLSSDDGGGQVQLLQIADQAGAEAYAKKIAAAKLKTSVYRGVDVSVDGRGLATAIEGGFLLIGREAGVRAVIDVGTGAPGSSSITDDPTASKIGGELPGDSVVDAYVSRLGLAGLFGDGGALSVAAQLVDPVASDGFGAALRATDDGLELSTRSSIDPNRAGEESGSDRNAFASLPSFDPALADKLQPDALAYVGIGDPESTLQGLLQSAGKQVPGVLGSVASALRRLGKSGDVDLRADLLPALGDEAAFALIPRVDPSSGVSGNELPGQPDQTQTLPSGAGAIPYIELLSDVSDESAAVDGLGKLQGSIARALGGKGKFSAQQLGGVQAQTVRISPTAQVAYSVFDSLLVFATDPAGVRTSADPQGDPLSATDLYQRASDGLLNGASLFAFFNVNGLRQFAEASGQAANPAYATFASDLRKLEGLGLSVSASDGLLSSDSRLLISAEAVSQLGGE